MMKHVRRTEEKTFIQDFRQNVKRMKLANDLVQ
jgi:hypothetical protein